MGGVQTAPVGNLLGCRHNIYAQGSVAVFDADEAVLTGSLGSLSHSRASKAWGFNSSGVVTEYDTNEHVIEYAYNGSSWVLAGLRREVARENIFTHSEDLTDAVWTSNNVTVTGDDATAPDGLTTADKVVEDTNNTNHRIGQTVSAVNGTTYTSSFFVKNAGRRYFVWRSPLYNGDFHTVAFDLSDEEVTYEYANHTGRIENCGSGWYRVSVTTTVVSTGSRLVYLYLSNTEITTDTFPSYTGDGLSGLYIWGAQCEVGAYPASYVPTAASTVTRAEDFVTGNPTWYDENGLLTFVGRVHAVSGSQYLFHIHNGTNNEAFYALLNASGSLKVGVRAGGSSQIGGEVTLGTVTAGTEFTLRLQIAENDFAAQLDTETVFTDTSFTPPSGLNDMEIGENRTAAQKASLHLKSLTWTPGGRI